MQRVSSTQPGRRIPGEALRLIELRIADLKSGEALANGLPVKLKRFFPRRLVKRAGAFLRGDGCRKFDVDPPAYCNNLSGLALQPLLKTGRVLLGGENRDDDGSIEINHPNRESRISRRISTPVTSLGFIR